MKKLREILKKEAEKNPEGIFDFDGMNIEYKSHHDLIPFSIINEGKRRIYLYNRKLDEVKYIHEKENH